MYRRLENRLNRGKASSVYERVRRCIPVEVNGYRQRDVRCLPQRSQRTLTQVWLMRTVGGAAAGGCWLRGEVFGTGGKENHRVPQPLELGNTDYSPPHASAA